MFVDKKPIPIEKDTLEVTNAPDNSPAPLPPKAGSEIEAVQMNPMVEAYKAVRKMLESIKKDPKDPNSPPLFNTIKLDNGQLSRLKNNSHNREYGLVLPAVLIHYIDVYYNVGASGVADGKGVMRLHYILNRLNISDDEVECEGMEIYKRIVSAIESQKSNFPALVNRFRLKYWEAPLTFDDAVQPYWIDYEIWFKDYTGYIYKDYVETYMTVPPFTQPSDQNEIANPDNLPDYTSPTFDEVSGFTTPFPTPVTPHTP